jgi:4a-hydroxytetrahydrobiopterin dehydratase
VPAKAAKRARKAKPKRAPRTPLLSPAERRDLGRRIPRWRVRGKRLVREEPMADFDAAMAFLAEVAGLASRADHHPDLHLTDYKKVRIELWSHDAGGLTVRDYSLAEEIDGLPGAWLGKAEETRAANAFEGRASRAP